MSTIAENSLEARIEAWEYCPEIYIYPTPRMYEPLPEFSYSELDLTTDLNVYVHVPFCKQFCSFCGYFKTIYTEELQEQFVEAVVKEIELRRGCFEGKTVKTLHFGGGTPSLLTPRQLDTIVQALLKVRPDILETSLEVSIEATPESIDREKFQGYREAGINRVSMGVQSLVDAEVVLANRCVDKGRTSFQMLTEAFEVLRGLGIPDVVIDLMIGIEGQTTESFEASLQMALSLRPETVQLYALGIMPQTALGRRTLPQLMPGPQIYHCYELGRRYFLEAGYNQDSHDRYTLHPTSGFLQGDYNIQGLSLIGLGAGARSYSRDLHFRNTYASLNGRKALLEYMANVSEGLHSVESGVRLDLDEQSRQYAIGHIQALDGEEFQRRFELRVEEKFPELYKEMLELKLVVQDNQLWRLTPKGLLFRDLLGRQMFSPRARALEEAYRNR
ncbi:MAG: coproporphyrinogen-III oxidase family protein [Vulcanimicrobiota bacterium]